MNKYIICLILSVACAIFYRLGGWSKGNKLFRRLGCPTLILGCYTTLFGFNAPWWAFLCVLGLSYGAFSTYWDIVTKDGSENWLCWILTGLGYGLALFPIVLFTGHWIGFTLRTLILAYLTMVWSEKVSWDIGEELGRGFLAAATIPLLWL